MSWSSTPDPSKFPDPDTWATWLVSRSPQFKTHKSLGTAKNACSGKMGRAAGADVAACDMYVYEWDGDGCVWRERFFIAKGTKKADAALYQQVVPRKKGVMPPSEKAVNAAIASIMSTTD